MYQMWKPLGLSHRVGRVKSFFSSRWNWDSTNSLLVCECTPPLVPGEGHTRWRERGRESPNSDERNIHCVLFTCTVLYVLCGISCLAKVQVRTPPVNVLIRNHSYYNVSWTLYVENIYKNNTHYSINAYAMFHDINPVNFYHFAGKSWDERFSFVKQNVYIIENCEALRNKRDDHVN
jgi:hypothetical protein